MIKTTRVVALLLTSSTLAATAQTQNDPAQGDLQALKQTVEEQSKRLELLGRSLEEQAKKFAADREALDAQRRRIEELERQLSAGQSGAPGIEAHRLQPDSRLEALAGRGNEAAQGGPEQAPQQVAQQQPAQGGGQQAPGAGGQAPQTVGQAPQPRTDTRPPEVAPIFQQPGVLTPKGQFVFEPSFQYSYSSSNRVSVIGFEIFPALLIGVLDIRQANRESYTLGLTGRYGISNRFEVEARLPYVYRRETLQTREFLQSSFVDSEFSASGHGIGDIELSGRYQINEGGMNKPYYVGTLRLKTRTGSDPFDVDRDPVLPRGSGRFKELPTGTGFYGVQPGVTMIYPTDPAVFFGSLSYLWNVKRGGLVDRAGQDFGEVDPGDAVGFNVGMGLALNEKASFSIGYDHSVFGKTKQNGQVPAGEMTTQLGTLVFGYSYKLRPNRNMNLSFGIGVTKDTPDLQLTLRIPTNF